jgi:hypothetical protein
MTADYNKKKKDSFIVTVAQIIAVLFPLASVFLIIASFHETAYDDFLSLLWSATAFFALCSCFVNRPQVLNFGKWLAIGLTLCFTVAFLIGIFHELSGSFSSLMENWIFALICCFYYLMIRYRIKRKNEFNNDMDKQVFEYSLADRHKKKMLILIVSGFLLLILAFEAISRLRWPAEGQFQGTLIYAFEHTSFRPDYSLKHWYFNDKGAFLERIHQDLANGTFKDTSHQDILKRKVNSEPHYRIKILAKLSPIGKEGTYGQYRRSLLVQKIIEYEYIGNK